MDITLDRAQAIAELLRAVQGKKVIHYLPHGANPRGGLRSGPVKRFVTEDHKVPHKDTPISALHVEITYDGSAGNGHTPMLCTEPVTDLVEAIECGRFYIDGDFSHSS